MEILERFTSKILAMKKENLLIIVLLFLLAYILIFRLPNKQQFKETRDSERAVHVISLRDSLEEYFAVGDSQKILPMIPDCSAERITIGASGLSLEALVDGGFLAEIPQDPIYGTKEDSGYSVCKEENQVKVYSDHYQQRSTYYAIFVVNN